MTLTDFRRQLSASIHAEAEEIAKRNGLARSATEPERDYQAGRAQGHIECADFVLTFLSNDDDEEK